MATAEQTSVEATRDLEAWAARVARYQAGDTSALPPGVKLGTLKVMGSSGDEPKYFPAVETLDGIREMPRDMVTALEFAQTVVETAFKRKVQVGVGANIFNFEKTTVFDPTQQHYLVSNQTTGG